MEYYDHGMVGATVAVAVGAERRHGWPIVALAALAGMFPDWDALAKHISTETYQSGHRVWGHNLFAATLAGVLLGLVGYWIHRSVPRNGEARGASPPGYWALLGVAVLWTHPLLDVLYCGVGREAEWPVRLFWPLTDRGFARPWIPWTDTGATILLAFGLLATVVASGYRRSVAVIALGVVVVYVAVKGAWLQWS